MRFAVLITLAVCTSATSALAEPPARTAVAPRVSLDGVEADRVRLSSALKPVLRQRLQPAIREVLRSAGRREKADLAAIARQHVVGIVGTMPDADTMALAFIVIMEAAKSAREDLKAIMDGVKAINEAKARCRERPLACIEKLKASGNLSAQQADEIRAQLEAGKTLDQIGADALLRLQTAQSTNAQLERVLAAIAQKAHETSASIVSNIKG
jgi:hypothetical protein